jgi:diguanylate cyclase (GGDEF)-like protein
MRYHRAERIAQDTDSAPTGTADDGLLWLDALPHAAAVIELVDGRPEVTRQNARFGRHHGHWNANPQGAGDPSPIERSCRDVLRAITGEAAFVWEPGGFQSRVFEVAIRPLGGTSRPAVVLSLVDRTVLARSEANLRRELLSDSLTGLPNRGGFGELIEQRLHDGQAKDEKLTLLVLDLKRFSRINESIGALAGDELILTVARRLRQQMRGSDLLARIGGDEFGILCSIKPADDGATKLAGRMARVFDDPFRIGDLKINIDCAIGGIADLSALVGTGDVDAPELIRQAQIALKQAKRCDCISFYEPVSLARLYVRFDRETALRAAIEQDGVGLAFQPLVDMKARRIVGFEALARWVHDDETISPGEFVPIAEDSGLIVPLGRRVLTNAMATLAAWDRVHGGPVPVHMSINVSPIQLARDDIVAAVREAMAATGIAGNRVMIEVTESSVVENSDAADTVLRALTALGVRIAMDDFGTGFSNIASLQRLPIDTLKIDRSLVAGIDTSSDSLAIVRTIQRLGEALGLKTTAEGIETETVAQQIAAIGCDTGQGYLFSRPLTPEAAFDAWRRTAGR